MIRTNLSGLINFSIQKSLTFLLCVGSKNDYLKKENTHIEHCDFVLWGKKMKIISKDCMRFEFLIYFIFLAIKNKQKYKKYLFIYIFTILIRFRNFLFFVFFSNYKKITSQ